MGRPSKRVLGLTAVGGVSEEELTVLMSRCERGESSLVGRSEGVKGDGRRCRGRAGGGVRSSADRLKEFSPSGLARQLEQAKYRRSEYVKFLIGVARDVDQAVSLRMSAFEKLDRLVRMIAVTHPAVSREVTRMLEEQDRDRGVRSRSSGRGVGSDSGELGGGSVAPRVTAAALREDPERLPLSPWSRAMAAGPVGVVGSPSAAAG